MKLFKRTFRFTGGEIVGEFLMSTGYLPGAHAESCPVYKRVASRRPAWMARAAQAERHSRGASMRIGVFGSGGVGGYFGGRLAEAGEDVRFVARGAHLAAMRAQASASPAPPATSWCTRCVRATTLRPSARWTSCWWR